MFKLLFFTLFSLFAREALESERMVVYIQPSSQGHCCNCCDFIEIACSRPMCDIYCAPIVCFSPLFYIATCGNIPGGDYHEIPCCLPCIILEPLVLGPLMHCSYFCVRDFIFDSSKENYKSFVENYDKCCMHGYNRNENQCYCFSKIIY